jgi:putative endonuclease
MIKYMSWQIYIIACTDNSLYTGITTDVERRFSEHLAGKQGARYFRGRTPDKVVYLESAASRSAASKREAAIKKLLRADKLRLLGSAANELNAAGVGLRT